MKEMHHSHPSIVRSRVRPKQLAPVAAALILSFVATVLAVLGVSPLPVWLLAFATLDVSLWGAAISYVAVVEKKGEDERAEIVQLHRRVLGLVAANGLLVALVLGIWIYGSLSSGSGFVNFVPNQNVLLSPEAGAPPRTTYDAPILLAGELQSAYCHVVVDGATWLDFRGGWAQLSAFHYPAGYSHRLPPSCD